MKRLKHFWTRRVAHCAAVVLLGLLLASCGGGGSSTPPPATNPPPPTTTAAVTLNGNELTVASRTLRAKFTQAALTSLVNLTTNENYIAAPGPNFISATMLNPDNQDLVPGAWSVDPSGTSASIEFHDTVRRVKMTVGVADDDMFLRFEGSSTTPGLVSISWGIFGLNLSPGRLVIPAQGGTYFDATSTPTFQGLDYPVHWENQMVVYQGGAGSVLMYARDPVPVYKRLHASRQTGKLDMAFEIFATAPWDSASNVASIEWRMRGYSGDWRAPADTYKSYLTSIRPFSNADGDRAWIKDVRGVVIFHTLDYSLLDKLALEVVPNKTVLLLTTWRQKPFDIDYPDYTPAADTEPFIQRAHQLGFHVMLHVNLLGVSETNAAYGGIKPYQIKTADEKKEMGWQWDEFPTGDIRRVAYISPASSAYRQLFINSIRPAINALQPDALHLDAGGAIVNDGNGLIEGMNGMQGIMQLHRDLMAAFPNVVLGGESTNEIIGPFNWLAQRWTADSPAHPISTYLLGEQVFFYGFLDQPTPDEAAFTDYLKRYEGQGIVPVPFVVDGSDLGPDRVRTHEFLDYIKIFQTEGFKPDWTGDWTGKTFRYKNAAGTSAITVEDDGTLLQLKRDGNVFYKRVHSTNTVTTPYFIQSWPAYDDTKILGTDPNRQFWLEDNPFRPQNELHLPSLPTNFQIGMGSLVTPKYGYFEIDAVNRNWYDFVVELAGARVGTIYNLQDFKLINGAVVRLSREHVSGVLYNSVLLEFPPFQQAVGGTTFIEYSVPVPIAPHVRLQFSAGMIDGSAQSDGVLMGVQINGATAWKQTIMPGNGWHDDSIDLTPFAGQTIKIKLLAHPGLQLNTNFDWSCWKDLKIVTDFSTAVNQAITLPAGIVTPQFSEGANLLSVNGQTANISLAVPGKFVVFAQDPPVINIGQSVLSFTPNVWKTTLQALPIQFANENSGTIGPIASAGVTRTAIAAIPPRRGATQLTTALRLPANATSLAIGFALADPPPVFGTIDQYSGVDFIVRVNGNELFRQRVETTGWNTAQIDIHQWAGKPILLDLTVDADENQLFDFAYWSDLTVH